MRDRQLFDDYASLIFKYCDEHSDFIIKRLAKLGKKSKSKLFSTKKKHYDAPKNGSEVDRIIQNLEINRKKNISYPEQNCPVSRFTFRGFSCICPLLL